jgi:hypothetical protein
MRSTLIALILFLGATMFARGAPIDARFPEPKILKSATRIKATRPVSGVKSPIVSTDLFSHHETRLCQVETKDEDHHCHKAEGDYHKSILGARSADQVPQAVKVKSPVTSGVCK